MMSATETKKLDELFRCLPKNAGLDPRLVEAAKTELDLLKFRSGKHVIEHKQEPWTKTDVEKLQSELQAKDTEIYILKQQIFKLKESGNTQTSDPNAPIQLRDKYTKLFEVEWKDAYEYFKEKGWNDIEIIVTLQRILRASHRFCHDVAAEQLQTIEGEALYPSASWMDDNGIITRMKTKEISEEITNLAKTYQRSTGPRCLRALQKVFTTHIIPTFIDPDRYFEREITVYTKLCVEITWYMCIQDPPMAFIDRINRGAEFETDYFRKFRGCHGNKFDYLVWPALLMYKGGPLVVKGVAQPIKKKHTVHEERLPESEVPYSTMKMPSRGTQRPYTDDVVMSHRDPDVFVDQTMEDDPWAQPHNQTPSQGYRQTPTYDERIEPSTPYFDPHNKHRDAEIPVINVTEATDLDEQNRSRSSRRSKGDSYIFDSDPGHGLTSQWKKSKMRDNRMPSAP